MHALFHRFPSLESRLPCFALGQFPTPVTELAPQDGVAGCGRLFVKRDDQSAPLYGGNKVRKLEFLLAKAQRRRARTVITFGFAGSNHCLATALYAREAGLGCVSLLLPQVNARAVQRNLLLGHAAGAELHAYNGWLGITVGTITQWVRRLVTTGRPPMVIPPGGSSALGSVGFVNAAFELAQQVEAGLMPIPDVVFVAMGSTGTTAGLHTGFRALGWPTRIVAVRVTVEAHANAAKTAQLISKTVALLRAHAPDFPAVTPDMDAVDIRGEFFGEGYGVFSPEGIEARDTLAGALGITLDGTYSAKAFAALLADARAGLLRDKTVLFWNTYNSNDLSGALAGLDYHDLPAHLHHYFEERVQPLDNGGHTGGGTAK